MRKKHKNPIPLYTSGNICANDWTKYTKEELDSYYAPEILYMYKRFLQRLGYNLDASEGVAKSFFDIPLQKILYKTTVPKYCNKKNGTRFWYDPLSDRSVLNHIRAFFQQTGKKNFTNDKNTLTDSYSLHKQRLNKIIAVKMRADSPVTIIDIDDKNGEWGDHTLELSLEYIQEHAKDATVLCYEKRNIGHGYHILVHNLSMDEAKALSKEVLDMTGESNIDIFGAGSNARIRLLYSFNYDVYIYKNGEWARERNIIEGMYAILRRLESSEERMTCATDTYDENELVDGDMIHNMFDRTTPNLVSISRPYSDNVSSSSIPKLSMTAGNRVGGDAVMIKAGFIGVHNNWSVDEFVHFLDSINAGSKDWTVWDPPTKKVEAGKVLEWCHEKYNETRISHSSIKTEHEDDTFLSNKKYLDIRDEAIDVQLLSRAIQTGDLPTSKYNKIAKRKLREMVTVISEIQGYLKHQDKRPREVKVTNGERTKRTNRLAEHLDNTALGEALSEGYVVPYVFLERLKKHHNLHMHPTHMMRMITQIGLLEEHNPTGTPYAFFGNVRYCRQYTLGSAYHDACVSVDHDIRRGLDGGEIVSHACQTSYAESICDVSNYKKKYISMSQYSEVLNTPTHATHADSGNLPPPNTS